MRTGSLVAIWARDPFLSAPLAIACQRIGFVYAVVDSANELSGATAGFARAVLLIGPRVPIDEVERAVEPLPSELVLAGIFFAAGVTPIDESAALQLQVHRLPLNLRALVATIRALTGE